MSGKLKRLEAILRNQAAFTGRDGETLNLVDGRAPVLTGRGFFLSCSRLCPRWGVCPVTGESKQAHLLFLLLVAEKRLGPAL